MARDKITPAVWDAVRQVVEAHPGVRSGTEGDVIRSLPPPAGKHLQTAIRAGLFVPVKGKHPIQPTRWRLTDEAQVELDKFLEGGAKVGGKRSALTDINVFALQELVFQNQHSEEGGDFLNSPSFEAYGVPAWRIRSSPHVRRLFEFGALERTYPIHRIRVTLLGRDLVRARLLVFPPPPRGQERLDAERRSRLPLGRIDYVVEKLGLSEAELDAARERRLPGNLDRYNKLLASTAKSSAGHSGGRSHGRAGRSVGTALLVGGAIVAGLLLLRPVFRDAFEQHKWNMEHDPAYRASHQAAEIANAASAIGDTLGSSAGRVIDRADAVRILSDHFRTHTRYSKWPPGARNWFFQLTIELMDRGADPASALALSHGLAHSLVTLSKFSRDVRSPEGPKGVWYLRTRPDVVAVALLQGKLKIARRPVLSVASEHWVRGS
jgi:hypothetical protein